MNYRKKIVFQNYPGVGVDDILEVYLYLIVRTEVFSQ